MRDPLKLVEVPSEMQPLVKHLAIGIDDDLVNQLIQKSQQPAILQYTPNDAKKRFGSQQMFHEWFAKGREIHWLLSEDNDLAGIIWYGKAPFPLDISLPETPTETFAIRIYEGYSGHGLARPFMKFSLQMYIKSEESNNEKFTGIWLQTGMDNPAALSVYRKFGYQDVAADDKRVTLVLPRSRIDEIMNVA